MRQLVLAAGRHGHEHETSAALCVTVGVSSRADAIAHRNVYVAERRDTEDQAGSTQRNLPEHSTSDEDREGDGMPYGRAHGDT